MNFTKELYLHDNSQRYIISSLPFNKICLIMRAMFQRPILLPTPNSTIWFTKYFQPPRDLAHTIGKLNSTYIAVITPANLHETDNFQNFQILLYVLNTYTSFITDSFSSPRCKNPFYKNHKGLGRKNLRTIQRDFQ